MQEFRFYSLVIIIFSSFSSAQGMVPTISIEFLTQLLQKTKIEHIKPMKPRQLLVELKNQLIFTTAITLQINFQNEDVEYGGFMTNPDATLFCLDVAYLLEQKEVIYNKFFLRLFAQAFFHIHTLLNPLSALPICNEDEETDPICRRRKLTKKEALCLNKFFDCAANNDTEFDIVSIGVQDIMTLVSANRKLLFPVFDIFKNRPFPSKSKAILLEKLKTGGHKNIKANQLLCHLNWLKDNANLRSPEETYLLMRTLIE